LSWEGNTPRPGAHLSRRDVLRQGGRGVVALVALTTGCGVRSAADRRGESNGPQELPPLAMELDIAQWPLYIDKKTVPRFEEETGIDVRYKEVINDNAAFFATLREPLAAGQATGWDLITLSDWVVTKMTRLDMLETIDHSLLPNVTVNIGDQFANPPYDPGNAHSIPWQGGITGVAYNRELLGRDITSFEELFDPELEGHVGMLTEMVDTMNLTLLMLGIDPQEATVADAEQAKERLIQQRESGIVRSYYGNDYLDGLSRGDLFASMAWSGDIFYLQQSQPEIQFVVPEEGGLLWVTALEIPREAEHPRDAHAFMDYVYDLETATNITEWVGYISPVPGVKEELIKRSAETKSDEDAAYLELLANSPLVFPTSEMSEKLHSYKVLDAEEEEAWNDLFSEVVQG
jgi:spermidine/putrescine transport system substrate-binding protein